MDVPAKRHRQTHDDDDEEKEDFDAKKARKDQSLTEQKYSLERRKQNLLLPHEKIQEQLSQHVNFTTVNMIFDLISWYAVDYVVDYDSDGRPRFTHPYQGPAPVCSFFNAKLKNFRHLSRKEFLDCMTENESDTFPEDIGPVIWDRHHPDPFQPDLWFVCENRPDAECVFCHPFNQFNMVGDEACLVDNCGAPPYEDQDGEHAFCAAHKIQAEEHGICGHCKLPLSPEQICTLRSGNYSDYNSG
jgi:hypothetical protein